MQQRGVITLKEKPISTSVWCGMFSGKLPKEHKHESYVVNGEIVKREEVSISKAAELAGLNIEEMKRVLADKGVEIKRGFTKNRKTAASELSGMMR